MKNKNPNKITSVLLAVFLVLTAFSVNITVAEAAEYQATLTTQDNVTTNFDTLANAVTEAMKNDGSVVTLNESVTLSGQLIMQSFTKANSLTIDLNGFAVSAGSTVFHIGGKTTLTVKDSKGTGSVNGLINLNNTAQVYLVGVKVIGVSTTISLKSADAMLIADKNSSITATNSFGKAIDLEGNIKIDGILKGGTREILYKKGTIDLSTNPDPDGIRIAPSSANYPLKMTDVKLPDGYYCFDVNGKPLEATATATDLVTVGNLKPADYTAVDQAIEQANALNRNDYRDFSAVDNAINAVDRTKYVSQQDEVDAMAKAILDAISKLEYKSADYSAVDKAIEKANALNKDDYSDFSAVEKAINAVDRSKNITQQDEVDAMAQAIFNAIDAVITAENKKSVEAIGAELEKFDENRVTIFWEDEIEALKAKIDELLADKNMGEEETAKLNEYKAQADKLIEIINNPVEYFSLRLFYLIWDFLTWKWDGLNKLFASLFGINAIV